MVEFIELLFLTSLWIWGVHCFMQLNLLKLNDNGWPKGLDWTKKPLYDCPPCMSSFHGTLSFWTFYCHEYFDYHFLPLWIVFCFCLCGLNYIIKEHLYES